uniref:Ig-like domain-containing protein n=1 Tax=Amphiprion ocellaris TaxID=80972 RepID=A0AAQ5YV24_AMPOC
DVHQTLWRTSLRRSSIGRWARRWTTRIDYDGNGHSSQHEQFRGRVSHFPDQLIDGNASIIIRNTKIEDTGIYTCIFPEFQDQRVSMRLVVGVAHEPYVSISDISESGVRLKCEAKGAFPEPKLQWLDSDGVVLFC